MSKQISSGSTARRSQSGMTGVDTGQPAPGVPGDPAGGTFRPPVDARADRGVGVGQLPASHPLLLRMRRGDRFGKQRLTDWSINQLVAKWFGTKYSAHTLRASFVTVSKKNGASNSEIMAQTHHKTEAMIRRYTRFEDARTHNAGTKLGL